MSKNTVAVAVSTVFVLAGVVAAIAKRMRNEEPPVSPTVPRIDDIR